MSSANLEAMIALDLDAEDEKHQDLEAFECYLTFILDKEEYAIEASRVWEIRIWEKATYLPFSEHYIKGVINTRGSIIPVVDLRLRFGLEESEPNQKTSIVLVQANGGDDSHLLGLIVDEVRNISEVPINKIQTELDTAINVHTSCILGTVNIGEKFLILLNQNNLLKAPHSQA